MRARTHARSCLHVRWCLHAMLAAALLSAPARANPADVLGFGSRAAGMAGAASALADDASANYYNPAGLARQGALRIDLGYQYGHPSLAMNGRDSGVDSIHGLTAGVAAPGEIGGVRIAFGAALFLPDDRVTRVRSLAYGQPQWVYYDNRPQRLYLAASLAVRVLPSLFVGAGLAFMSRTSGTVTLRGRIGASDPEDSQLASSVSVDLLAIRYPQAGVLWEPTRYLALSLCYRHSFLLRVDQGFIINGDVGDSGNNGHPPPPPIVAGGSLVARSLATDLFQPWQLTAGAALRLTRRVLLAVDVSYERWSEFPGTASDFTLSIDVGPALNPLVHLPPAAHRAPPGFHDILVPRIGVEARALERTHLALDLRAGYRYEPTPVPEQTGETNYIDGDKHELSVGAGVTLRALSRYLPGSIALDAHFAATLLPDRANRKLDPVDPIGDVVGGGVIFETGVTNRWTF
jgi:long-chain fatty acid transport protein